MFRIMSGVLSTCFSIFRLGPRQFYRVKLKLPVIQFVHDTLQLYKTRTEQGVNNVRNILLRGIIVAFVTSLLVWLSIFMYLAFYYVYVPVVSHEKPVSLQFKPCEQQKGLCSFPSAHIQLTKRQQLLMYGQPYRVSLELEIPESPSNKDLGMFMVCAEFRGKDGKLVANSCVSAMLRYRSWFVDVLQTVIFSPMIVFGGSEEKQKLYIELFSDYEDYENYPVTDVYIEIQSRHIQYYSAKFLIHAHFTGLRYVMFNWPVLSAAIGITTNLFFIAIICMISWYQLIHSEEYQNYVSSKETRSSRFEHFPDDLEDSSSTFDDTSMFGELEESREKERPVDDLLVEEINPNKKDC